jgi:hypothetical protein
LSDIHEERVEIEDPPLQGNLTTELLCEVNNRLAEIQADAGHNALTLLCECARPFCTEQVVVARERFTALRAQGKPVLAPLHRQTSA